MQAGEKAQKRGQRYGCLGISPSEELCIGKWLRTSSQYRARSHLFPKGPILILRRKRARTQDDGLSYKSLFCCCFVTENVVDTRSFIAFGAEITGTWNSNHTLTNCNEVVEVEHGKIWT